MMITETLEEIAVKLNDSDTRKLYDAVRKGYRYQREL